MENNINHSVAVIGAGPAGLYAADYLAKSGAQVALINRDIKYGGLAEYGIYHTKHKMKNGLRNQFEKILDSNNIHYFGNLNIGENNPLTIENLQEMGFSAILVTVGAQGTKWLGLPGEELNGVYHAKDLVYHYNQLPPYSSQEFPIGKRVVIIGVGNVMIDIASWVIRDLNVDQVTAIARRGPAAVKFDKKELSTVFNNLNIKALDAELDRTKSIMQAVGQDPAAAKEFILSAQKLSIEAVSNSDFRLEFLQQPKKLIGDENGKVIALEVEETTLKLAPDGKSTKSVGLGTFKRIETDTVVFCIGDQVDQQFGLPLDKWGDFAKNPDPAHPINNISYEAFDNQLGKPVESIFLAGWAREASSGLVGTARKDGINGAKSMTSYIEGLKSINNPSKVIQSLYDTLNAIGDPYVTSEEIKKLSQVEKAIANEKDLPHFKFSTNEEMLKAVERIKIA